jgi:hypothetical protein
VNIIERETMKKVFVLLLLLALVAVALSAPPREEGNKKPPRNRPRRKSTTTTTTSTTPASVEAEEVTDEWPVEEEDIEDRESDVDKSAEDKKPTNVPEKVSSTNTKKNNTQSEETAEDTESESAEDDRPFMKAEVKPRDGCSGALDDIERDDVHAIVNNTELYSYYVKCILANDVGTARCNCAGWELRRIMTGLLNPSLCPRGTKATYCPTEQQRARGQDFMKYLSKFDNQTWKDILRKYAGKGSNNRL